MAGKREDISKQALELWKKTVMQLDEISKSLKMGPVVERIKADSAKLALERDRLLKRLGEETYKLIDKNKIKVPDPLKKIYDRIRTQADKFLGTKKSKKSTKTTNKKTARKPAKRKVVRKKAAKRKTTRKTAAKKV